MGVIKPDKQSSYFKGDNYCVQRTDMSIEAKGVISYLISLPTDWKIRPGHVAQALGIGKEKLGRIFQELQQHRYLVKVLKRGEDGRIEGADFIACSVPMAEGIEDEGEFSATGTWIHRKRQKPDSGKTATTKEIKTNTVNTEQKEKDNVVSPSGESDTPPPAVVGSGKVSLKPAKGLKRDTKPDLASLLEQGMKNKPRSKERVGDPNFDPFFDAWNELTPNLPNVTERGRRGLKSVKSKLRGLIREFGFDEALEIFEDGCKEVNLDEFWREKRYGIDNLARHAVEKAEKWASRRDNPQSSDDLPAGMDPNSAEATAWLLKHGELEGRGK